MNVMSEISTQRNGAFRTGMKEKITSKLSFKEEEIAS